MVSIQEATNDVKKLIILCNVFTKENTQGSDYLDELREKYNLIDKKPTLSDKSFVADREFNNDVYFYLEKDVKEAVQEYIKFLNAGVYHSAIDRIAKEIFGDRLC